MRNDKGFGLVEILLVTVIVVLLSGALIFNFGANSKSKTARKQTASTIISDIRRAQSMALSGKRVVGDLVCGFGIHYASSASYDIYAKPIPSGTTCAVVSNFNYQAGDLIVEQKPLINSNMRIISPFYDIFFKSPDPTTYIDNSPVISPAPVSTTINIGLKGQTNCGSQSCTHITVDSAGKIDIDN